MNVLLERVSGASRRERTSRIRRRLKVSGFPFTHIASLTRSKCPVPRETPTHPRASLAANCGAPTTRSAATRTRRRALFPS